MAAKRIWLRDREMLDAIRKAKDLLPELHVALQSNANDAMKLAAAIAPRDTGELARSAFVEGIETNPKGKTSNVRFGFRHPQAAFIEEGIRWGRGTAQHGIRPPRFLAFASREYRKRYVEDCRDIVNRWLEKNFKR